MFTRKAKVDKNQPDVVKEFRKLGFSVLHIHQIKNAADLVVSKENITALIEVKDGSLCPSARKLTKGEWDFMQAWQGLYYICESIEEVHIIAKEMLRRSAL